MRSHGLTTRAAVFCTTLASLCTTLAAGEVIITYESYDDETPGDPSIDVCLGCSATIEVWVTPTHGIDTTLGSGAFIYDGDAEPGGIITNGGIVLSNHHWDVVDGGFVIHDLPDPVFVFFGGGVHVPVEGLILSTLTVEGSATGAWNQETYPNSFSDYFGAATELASGSDSFSVRVTIEDCDHAGDPDPENDCNDNGVWDICEIVDGTSEDCNITGVPDACELANGSSGDCNANAVPDECEADVDCNGNQRPDECDLNDGTSGDCNANDVPDECETAVDCNGNQRPDACDLADGTNHDCNDNLVLDECDIASGASLDENLDTFPDECGPCTPTSSTGIASADQPAASPAVARISTPTKTATST